MSTSQIAIQKFLNFLLYLQKDLFRNFYQSFIRVSKNCMLVGNNFLSSLALTSSPSVCSLVLSWCAIKPQVTYSLWKWNTFSIFRRIKRNYSFWNKSCECLVAISFIYYNKVLFRLDRHSYHATNKNWVNTYNIVLHNTWTLMNSKLLGMLKQ